MAVIDPATDDENLMPASTGWWSFTLKAGVSVAENKLCGGDAVTLRETVVEDDPP